MLRRLSVICLLGGVVGCLMVGCLPVHTTLLKLVLIGSVLLVWVGLMLLLWKRRVARGLLMLLPLLTLGFVWFSGAEINHAELRADYVSRWRLVD
jgi:hypothetical protein